MGQNSAYVFSSKEGKVNYVSEKVCVEVGEVLSGYIVHLDEKDLEVSVEIRLLQKTITIWQCDGRWELHMEATGLERKIASSLLHPWGIVNLKQCPS